MFKRLMMVTTLAAVLAAPSFASDCPPPGSSPLGDGSKMGWGDYLIELVLDLGLGPSAPYSPSTCTDVDIYFE